jgi:hypothetical protein
MGSQYRESSLMHPLSVGEFRSTSVDPKKSMDRKKSMTEMIR